MNTLSGRIVTLDYLKAFSILFVIITHSSILNFDKKLWLFPYWIDMAVPFFMIISSYVFTISAQKNKITTLASYFSCHFFIPKFLRFFIPYLIFFMTELIYVGYLFPLQKIGQLFITGGFLGPGSYYVPVLLQFLVFFPIMLYLMKYEKYFIGAIILVIFQLIFEYSAVYFNLSPEAYRLMFFRYISFVLAGIILAKYKVPFKWIVISFLSGLAYIYLVNYTSYYIPFFYGWKVTSMPTVLYAFFFVYGALYLNSKLKHTCKGLSLIGMASYHVFLVQTFYFTFFKTIIANNSLRIGFNLFICIGLGIIFFFLMEKYFSRPLKKMLF